MKILAGFIDFKQKINFKTEILAGLTVAMTMIPESLSFALLAGFPPLVGLYGACIMAFVTAILGGRPGLVSGGAGATVITLIALMRMYGIEYVFAAVVVAGIIQILAGVFKWGKFIRLVPQSVMFGFVNGLAIVIFSAQIAQFKVVRKGQEMWMTGSTLYLMLALVLLTMLIVWLFPKLTKAVPASLAAIIVVFALVTILGIPTKQIKDIATIKGTLPPFHIPQIPFTMAALLVVLPYGLVMAAVGLTEGLLTLNLVDEITNTRGNSNRECVAQGVGNILCGFFNGMGGCPMIAQTLVNLDAGSRARLSAIIAGLTILFIILAAAPVIEYLPIAALTGVMMVVAITTFEWASFKALRCMPKADMLIMLVVTLVTICFHNLALAVLIGVLISALVFAWESAKRIRARKYIDENGAKHYEIYGPLFFGSITAFMEKFDVNNDPNEVVIDFSESRISDMSAMEALNKITNRYAQVGKKVVLENLSEDCKSLLNKANHMIEVHWKEEPFTRLMR